MNIPKEVASAVAKFDDLQGTFNVLDVHYAITDSIKDRELTDEENAGYRAEMAAFGFDAHPAPNGGPWKSYFQPAMTFAAKDGSPIYGPDIAFATTATIEYWSTRAKSAKHPILAARYADLVWDFGHHVTGSSSSIEFARLAIDSYITSLKMDNGDAWGDNHYNVERVLKLALSINDSERTINAVEAVIDYAERTSDDDKIGTYCYLFDLLLPPKKGPALTSDQEVAILTRFETRFSEMTTPGGSYDASPHSPLEIGRRLASYYKRKGREQDRVSTIKGIALAFERRAKIGDALGGVMFLDDARKFYIEAGLKDEAERVLRESEELAPEAKKRMSRHSVEIEIPDDSRQEFLDGLMSEGVMIGLSEWTRGFITDQDKLKEQLEETNKQFIVQSLFKPTILGDDGIKAKVDDIQGDPDGPMIFETAKRMNLSTVWISWGLDHLIENGLTSQMIASFIAESPVFLKARFPLIQRGIEAHILGDYVQAIHILLPQIESALVGLIYMLGGASTKPHRSGRGVIQSKSLNDALANDAVKKVLGPDLTMYLIAALSHPKGNNIRNEVCHGLWDPGEFTKEASERVLHTMTALSLLRKKPK